MNSPTVSPLSSSFDAALHAGVFVPLTQFGIIDTTGDDAAAFLHTQLTSDVQHLDASNARLAGYCSPKGRLLASFLMWRCGEAVRLMLAADIQASVQKRLSMFVMRAKRNLSTPRRRSPRSVLPAMCARRCPISSTPCPTACM